LVKKEEKEEEEEEEEKEEEEEEEEVERRGNGIRFVPSQSQDLDFHSLTFTAGK
jgi:hypothetical protein